MTKHIRILLLMSLVSLANNVIEAQTPMQKAEQFYIRSQNDSALKYLKMAESIFLKNNNDSLVVVTKNRIARILINENLVDSAIVLLKSTHEYILQKYGDQNELISVSSDLLGDCYMSYSDVETAVKHYRQAYNIRKLLYPDGHINISYSYANIARYYSFKINKDSAYFYARRGFDEFDNKALFNWDYPYERILIEHAYAYKIILIKDKTSPLQNLEKIRQLYTEAAAYVAKQYGDQSRQMASIYRHIGNTFTDEVLIPNLSQVRKAFLFKQANYYYDKSLAIISATQNKISVEKSTLHYVKALVFEYCYINDSIENILHQYDLAITELVPDYKSNDTIYQSAMRNCKFKYDLMTLITSKASCYYKFQYNNGNKHALKQAYLLLTQSAHLWNQIILEFEAPYANRLITLYNLKIFDFLTEIAWKLYNIEHDPNYLRDLFKYSELSKTSLQHRLLIDAGFDNLFFANVNVTDHVDVQKHLSKNALYIDFYSNNFVTAISRDTFIVNLIEHKYSPDSLLNEYKLSILNNDVKNYQSSTARIFNSYLAPVIEACNFSGDELIIASDGLISNISICGLVTDTISNANDFRKLIYAGRKYKIRYVLSAQNMLNNSKTKMSENDSMVVFVPEFKNYSSLPFSTQLANDLHEKIPSRVYYGDKASSKMFFFQAAKYNFIHLVTHAEGNQINPGMTRLLFSDLSTDDYFIPVESILRMKLNANLAVLSACETNIGFFEYGEGTMNFAKAFIYAGTKSTVTTQWRVDDRSTASILSEFYNHIYSHKSLSASLQAAQLHYLNSCKTSAEANPMYWSGLNLTGADNNIYLKSQINYKFWISTAAVGMLLIAGIYGANKYRHPHK